MTCISKLAVIPAKSHFEQCPGNNTRPFAGRPLFLYSVSYALQEGFVPVVNTDCEDIIAICRQEGILHIRGEADDCKLEACVNQVIERFGCEMFAVLQSASPFRAPGLLRRMAYDVEHDRAISGYTSPHLKLIGHLKDRLQGEGRPQDGDMMVHLFDGNILVCKQQYFQTTGSFFDDDARGYPNRMPCCLRIDSQEDWAAMEDLALSVSCSYMLAGEGVRKKRVCLVSNRRFFDRDYSAFIDSCDVVIRVSKMDNLDLGLTGSRTDMVLISCWEMYMTFSRKERHVEALKQVPLIYFSLDEKRFAEHYAETEGFKRWKFIPDSIQRDTNHFTTTGKAMALAVAFFPDAELYYLGDMDSSVRTGGQNQHTRSGDDAFFRRLVESGRMIPILEEDRKAGFLFSVEITAARERQVSDCILTYGRKEQWHDVIRMQHLLWSDTVRIVKNRCRREKGGDMAVVERVTDGQIRLLWDKWPAETFLCDANGVWNFVSDVFLSRMTKRIRDGRELIVSPYSGPYSIFRNTHRPFLGLAYDGWDFLVRLDELQARIEHQIRQMPGLDSILFLGICKDSLAALILALRVQEAHPDLHVGVFGCGWIGALSAEHLYYKGICLSPLWERLSCKEPYGALFRQYSDPLILLQEAERRGVRVHAFAFYAIHEGWGIERTVTERLAGYLNKTYVYRSSPGEHGREVHGKMLHLYRKHPDICARWFDEMFHLMLQEKHAGQEETEYADCRLE